MDDEANFWRGFIEWWVREREGPVPPRAWEALALAEAKRCSSDGLTGPVPTRTTDVGGAALN